MLDRDEQTINDKCRHERKMEINRRQAFKNIETATQGSMPPAEIWAAPEVSKQRAMDLLRPLIDAGLVKKTRGKMTGRYTLRQP